LYENEKPNGLQNALKNKFKRKKVRVCEKHQKEDSREHFEREQLRISTKWKLY
jgi:hypothetical protein